MNTPTNTSINTSINTLILNQSPFETAILGGGCFWCTEAVFLTVRGVHAVESGYAAGNTLDPIYETICTGTTGHAEVVKIQFDPNIISYEQLLHIFFYTHDATNLNRQGNDIGTQYRSIVLTLSDEQAATVQAVLKEIQAGTTAKIVTQIKPYSPDVLYYRAEEYHQNYYAQHPYQGYCAALITPKLAKFKKTMQAFIR
jgi:peptide-methionine (S)-S-oxide reductase